MRRIRVLLDTNFLMIPIEYEINVFDEIEKLLNRKPEYITISSVINELKEIAKKGKVKERKAALTALKLVNEYKVKVIEDYNIKGEKTDEKIINLARILKGNVVIATNDRELRLRIRKMGIPVIMYRERDHRLWLDGEV